MWYLRYTIIGGDTILMNKGVTVMGNPGTDAIIDKMAHTFSHGHFKNIRAQSKSSPFGEPSSMYGHTPHLTANDKKNKFYIMEIVLEPSLLESDEFAERLKAFAKRVQHHQATFWIFVKDELEDRLSGYIEDLGIQEQVNRIKAIKG